MHDTFLDPSSHGCNKGNTLVEVEVEKEPYYLPESRHSPSGAPLNL